jgi:hypothetical protein
VVVDYFIAAAAAAAAAATISIFSAACFEQFLCVLTIIYYSETSLHITTHLYS